MKKKKRKNKSAVALLRKRKSFGILFLKRWIAVLLVSVLAYRVGVDYFVKEMQNMWKGMYYSSKDSIIETINNGPLDESYEAYINRVEFIMASKQETRTASLLCNAETGEIIADCREQIYITKKRDEGKALIYACPTANIEGWDEYREKYVANRDSSYYLSENIEMDYIYVNGADFVPGSFKVINRPYDINTGESTDALKGVLTTEFEEPKDLSSDYVKTELNDEWTLWFAYGYNENDTTLYSGSYEGYKELQENYQHFLETGSTYLGGELHTEQKMILSDEIELVMPSGEKAMLMTVYYYDVWDDYSTYIIIAGILIFVVGLIVSLIWAKLSHAKLKAQYDMEDYRKTLMNTMAHDLKSPLMSISGYAENLRNNINTDKHEYYSDAILGNVQHMNNLIESILTLGKTEKAGISLKKENVRLKTLIDNCTKKYDLQMKEKNLTLDVEGDISFNIDASLFAHAIDNLIGNAVKYATENSLVKVTMSGKTISVTNKCDTTIDVDIATLTEPFVVGIENRSDKCGNGLGLAIVNNICILHRFSLEIKYENNEFTAEIHNKCKYNL